MKKVRIMLTAIAILAVVGGVLAFKAKNFANVCFYSSTTTHTGQNGDYCSFNPQANVTITDRVGAPVTYGTTIDNVGPCPADPGVPCTQLISSDPEVF